MTIRTRLFAVAAVVAVFSVNGHAQTQTQTQTAKTDGKAFAGTLRPRAAAEATTTPTPDRVPGYSGTTPSQSSFYTNPNALAPAASSAATSSTGYQAVTDSMASRATFNPVDLDATVARGKTVATDPMTYTSGFAAGGTPGSCVALPPGGGSAGTYEATCNTGYVATPVVQQSCSISLAHRFETANRYECSEFNAGSNDTDDCAIFRAARTAGQCQQTGSRPGRCLQMGSHGCVEPGEPIELLTCSITVPGAELLRTSTVYAGSTPDDAACAPIRADATCRPDADICTDNQPVTRIVSGVSITQPCWAWSRTYTCGSGVSSTPQSDCSALPSGCVFDREVCITEETPCLTVDRIYKCPLPSTPSGNNQYICGDDVYCLNGECDTIERTPNTEFKDAAVALNAASEAGKEFDPNNLTLFRGTRSTCSKAIFGLTNCCVPRGFPIIGSCSTAEKALAKNQDDGLCAYVGTYCSHKVLGVCTEKREAHCCFLSKISRILQEQGRQQLPKPWLSPKTEQCLGFTLTEFARLDLSRMDFSEVYAEFTGAARLPDEMDTASQMQTKITNYFNANQ